MKWRYWLDFWAFPLAVALTVLLDARSLMWIVVFIFGFCFWTFAEYWTHRSVLHKWLWHGTHEHHHLEPAEFVESIWWYTPVLFTVLWFIFPIALWGGFAAGYVWFLTMHHWLHHRSLTPGTWIYRYAIWHGRHHKFNNCNYGITTSIWDYIFRSSR